MAELLTFQFKMVEYIYNMGESEFKGHEPFPYYSFIADLVEIGPVGFVPKGAMEAKELLIKYGVNHIIVAGENIPTSEAKGFTIGRVIENIDKDFFEH